MPTRFSVPPLSSVSRQLADVASARSAPDLVITGGRVLSPYSERFLPDKEIWVTAGRIAAVKAAGSYKASGLSGANVYDVNGGILAPGGVDPHVHIESSMMTVCAYAEAALLNGTTTLFCDSHEIGNVSDVAGIEWMLEDARHAPLSVFLTVPSTVPAAGAQFETAGGDLTPDKIGEIFDQWPEAVALGEKMDHVAVTLGDPRSHAILAEAHKRGRPVCGHCYGQEFVAAYAASGITDTHEAIDEAIAEEFLESGLWLFMRAGNPRTAWHALPDIITLVTKLGANTKRLCLCTDDRDAEDLFLFGLDWCARETMRSGLNPLQAWSMISLHPATRYAMDHEIGALGHSRRADIVLLDDAFVPQNTWYGGELLIEGRKPTPQLEEQLTHKRWPYPQAAYETVRLPGQVELIPELPDAPCVANVMEVKLPGVACFHQPMELEAYPDWTSLLGAHDLCHVAVVERHGLTGTVGHGLMAGFKLSSGAVASSVGHDAHNIVIAGADEASMEIALRAIETMRGGIVMVEDGEVIASVPLPLSGLLSDKRATDVQAETEVFKRAWEAKGLGIPYMGFNLIPLSVIPDIRLTDKGLIIVKELRQIPLFEPVDSES
ncbi:adenine deaminase C-terminal domain-containing protein [Coraliomargarita parva]|uniref:adenine deaminase C-terminal domain-containing protein n=1 Tax=Coraliomargarita parva TaxID=3014050 RepID=UPI0022B3D939|nr:adenine deaminase C-terminal domain-containing protein [Coraliomargarita parva]